jgi:hypothetical protein
MSNSNEKVTRPMPTTLRDEELSSASGGNNQHPNFTYGTSPAHGHAVPGWKPGEGPKTP